jgi:Cu/Ag efflux protein CusF
LVKCRRERAVARTISSTLRELSPEQIRSIQAYRELLQNLEVLMRLARTVLAAVVLTSISSVTLAQQTLTGTVTTIDRINGTIAIQQTRSGTVGANGGGATERFKVQDGMLNTVHAGDKVAVTVSETGGTKTVTKLEKQ